MIRIKPKYYKQLRYNYIPLYWYPGKFFQIKSSTVYLKDGTEFKWMPWFVAWYPRTPCYFCDKIELFNFTPHRFTPKLWRATYVELGADADKHNLPLGLKFSKGRAFTLPLHIKQLLVYMLKFFDDSNICTSLEEMDYLIENNYMFPYYNDPVCIMDKYENQRINYAITLIDVECIWQTSNLKEK